MTDRNFKISGGSPAEPIKLWQTLILCAVCSLAAALSAAAGSVFFMCVGGVSFAFLLLHSSAAMHSRAVWGCLPLSYALALLFSNDPFDPFFSLAALLFFPVGAALYLCVKRRAPLSVTTAVLCLVITLCTCALFGAVLYSAYGSITEGAKQYLSALESILDSFIAQLASVTDSSSGIALFSDQTLAMIRENIIMQTPAFIIVGLELLAFGTAKLFLLLCIMFSRRALLPSPWRLKVTLPTSLLFVVSYIVYTLSASPSPGVIYYSAASLVFILMPPAAVSGFHAMFKKDCSPKAKRSRVFLIVMCAVFLIIGSLFTLLSLFCFWGAYDSLRTVLTEKAERRDGDDL